MFFLLNRFCSSAAKSIGPGPARLLDDGGGAPRCFFSSLLEELPRILPGPSRTGGPWVFFRAAPPRMASINALRPSPPPLLLGGAADEDGGGGPGGGGPAGPGGGPGGLGGPPLGGAGRCIMGGAGGRGTADDMVGAGGGGAWGGAARTGWGHSRSPLTYSRASFISRAKSDAFKNHKRCFN